MTILGLLVVRGQCEDEVSIQRGDKKEDAPRQGEEARRVVCLRRPPFELQSVCVLFTDLSRMRVRCTACARGGAGRTRPFPRSVVVVVRSSVGAGRLTVTTSLYPVRPASGTGQWRTGSIPQTVPPLAFGIQRAERVQCAPSPSEIMVC